jgi:hypothetical protein
VELQEFLQRIAGCRERVERQYREHVERQYRELAERLGPGRSFDFDWSSVPPLRVAGETQAVVAGSARQGS